MPLNNNKENTEILPAKIMLMGGGEKERIRVLRILESEGHSIIEAEDGRAFVEKARDVSPDLVILDMTSIPADGGYETVTRLRSFPETQFVPIVTIGPPDNRDRALSLGCDGFISTPLKGRTFSKEIRSYLKGKRQRVRSDVQREHLEAYSKSLVEKLEEKIDELTLSNEKLRQLDDLKNRILENVSHELATPLTPLIGHIDLLETGKLGPLVPRQRKALLGISHGIRRLGRTVDNLLDLASLEDVSRSMLCLEHFDPGSIAEESLEALQEKAHVRKVSLSLRYSESYEVLADRTRLKQSLVHLLDNAVTFSRRGGQVLLEITRSNGKVRFVVYDQGEVIPAEMESQVFDLFSPPGRRSPEGVSGPTLGLAVARRIAENLGGRVWVESPPKMQPDTTAVFHGARFGLEVPIYEPEV